MDRIQIKFKESIDLTREQLDQLVKARFTVVFERDTIGYNGRPFIGVNHNEDNGKCRVGLIEICLPEISVREKKLRHIYCKSCMHTFAVEESVIGVWQISCPICKTVWREFE